MCKIAETELGPVEYSVEGKGHPIVFFHGGHSNCKEILFHKGYDRSRFELITPSRPGYGNTPLRGHTTPKDTACLFHKLMEKLGHDQVTVVGISAGGLSAIEYAARYPKNTLNMILISAVTKKWMNEDHDNYVRGKKMFSPKREKLIWKIFRVFFSLFPKMMTHTLFKEISTVSNPTIYSDEIKEVKDMIFRQSSGTGFIADLDHDIEEQVIDKVQCPTLILHSENDQSVSIDMAHHADKHIDHSTLITYENKWGHLLWVGGESKAPIEDLNKFLSTTNKFS